MFSPDHDSPKKQTLLQKIHIDLPLLIGLITLMILGLFVVYSAGGQETA